MKERVNWGGEQKDEAPEIQLRSQVNRVFGAEGSNRSDSFTWAGEQKKFWPMPLRFILISPLIEFSRNWCFGCAYHSGFAK